MQGDLDLLALGGDDAQRVLEGGKLKPELAEARHRRTCASARRSLTFTYFNMNDPAVGGYSNAQVALRRAIAMGFNIDELIRVLFAGNALPANQLLPPGVNGHDAIAAARSRSTIPRARARCSTASASRTVDGDGYRETPDGKPLDRRARHAARIVVPRSRHAVAEEHGRDRHQDAGATSRRSPSS